MEQSLFPAALISKKIAASLPAGYTLRPLQSGDFERGVLDVLQVLTSVGDVSRAKFLGNINNLTLFQAIELIHYT